jgi:TPR repeat protein
MHHEYYCSTSSADSIKLQELGKAYYNIRKLSCSSCQAEGFSVFSKYANEGDVKCMYQLYRCLLKGWGTEQDFPKAISWLKQAAEKGHEAALKELFLAYKDGGYGVEQNLPLACQCAVRLSSLNNSTGLYNMDTCCTKDWGVPKIMKRQWIASVKQL